MVRPWTPEFPKHVGPDFIALSADRRAQVDPNLSPSRTVQGFEGLNPLFHDPRQRSPPACVKQRESPGNGIEKIYRHAVRGGHREKNTWTVRRQAIRVPGDAESEPGDGSTTATLAP